MCPGPRSGPARSECRPGRRPPPRSDLKEIPPPLRLRPAAWHRLAARCRRSRPGCRPVPATRKHPTGFQSIAYDASCPWGNPSPAGQVPGLADIVYEEARGATTGPSIQLTYMKPGRRGESRAARPDDEMHILVTNDDGIQAAGLHALAQALRPLGDVTVLAPDRNWSASGHVKTMHRPLRVREVELPDGTPALSSDGAPSDCVALAVLGVLDRPIDMVVSGINPNANLGHDVTYSGTVTAAMEAAIQGLPGIAVW